jgi:type II secretory pathway pseudopilin PulG
MNNSARSPAWRTNRVHGQLTKRKQLFYRPTITNKLKKIKKTKMNDFKTINKRARQRGTTLIELSIVIAVLLLLVGVLFVGITAWKNGANKAACLVNVSSIQKAVRGYGNMNGINIGGPCGAANIVGVGQFFAAMPKCPSTAVAYVAGTVIPADGVPWTNCVTAGPPSHVLTLAQTANW